MKCTLCNDTGIVQIGELNVFQACPNPLHYQMARTAREQAEPKPLKRYLAFYGNEYYPCKGMDDFIGDFDTISEAQEAIDKKRLEDDCLVWDEIWDSWLRESL